MHLGAHEENRRAGIIGIDPFVNLLQCATVLADEATAVPHGNVDGHRTHIEVT